MWPLDKSATVHRTAGSLISQKIITRTGSGFEFARKLLKNADPDRTPRDTFCVFQQTGHVKKKGRAKQWFLFFIQDYVIDFVSPCNSYCIFINLREAV